MKRLKRLLKPVIALSLFVLTGCSGGSGQDLKVVSDKTVELGETVSLAPSEYLLNEPDESILNEITVDSDLKTDSDKYTYNGFKETVTSKDKKYLDIGTYKLTLKYDGKDYPVTLRVEDTVMPEFISPSAVVTIPVGKTDFDFSKIYRTDDKSDVEIRLDGFYNLNKEGTYPVTIVATDAAGNTNSIEITINVVADNTHITASDQFDDEVVPSPDGDDTSNGPQTPVIPDPEEPVDDQKPDKPSVPTACSISTLPAGAESAEVYYSFSDLYAAGTAWNQLSPNNYFFYLEGADDCGNKVYFLTKGTQTPDPSAQPQQTPNAAGDDNSK